MDELKRLEKRIEGMEGRLSKVQELYEKTISYANSDPRVSLQQARIAAEAICKQIFSKEINENVGNLMLDKLIEKLYSDKHVTKQISLHLKTIQQYGNYASHDHNENDQDVSCEFIQPCLDSLSLVVNWYFNDYLKLNVDGNVKDKSKLKKFAQNLKLKLIQETQLERLSFGLSLNTDDENVIDTSHRYNKLKRIDIMDHKTNQANSYRWLEITNVSNQPTNCIYHKECGENKISFEQFKARAYSNSPNGTKLIIDNLVNLQPSFVQIIRINFDKPLLPNEMYKIFYRITWEGELLSYSDQKLSQSISLTRYKNGVSWLQYGLLEQFTILGMIAEKTTVSYIQENVPETRQKFKITEEPDLKPLHCKDYNEGYRFTFENPDGIAYRFKYRLAKENVEEGDEEF